MNDMDTEIEFVIREPTFPVAILELNEIRLVEKVSEFPICSKFTILATSVDRRIVSFMNIAFIRGIEYAQSQK